MREMIQTEAMTSDDATEVDRLLDIAFGLERRTKTSYRLREGSSAAEGLSRVVRERGVGVVGAISFWPLRIGRQGIHALLLGPLAVHPERQNRGIGLTLMREGLATAKALGYRLVLLVGDQPYYARVGFQLVKSNDILLPGPVNRNRLLFLELVPGAMQGVAGLVLPPHRFARTSAPLAIPHAGSNNEQSRQTEQG